MQIHQIWQAIIDMCIAVACTINRNQSQTDKLVKKGERKDEGMLQKIWTDAQRGIHTTHADMNLNNRGQDADLSHGLLNRAWSIGLFT